MTSSLLDDFASFYYVGFFWQAQASAIFKQGYLKVPKEETKERLTFGKPLADRQAIQWMLAESEMDIKQLRLLAYKTAWMLDEGRDARKEVARVKCLAPWCRPG